MARYIDADLLYESTTEWEASAMEKVIERANKTPVEKMTDDERVDWLMWSAILGERTSFKHDIADAPTADVRENVHAKFVSEIIKKEDWKGRTQSYYQSNSCSNCHTALTGKENFCPNCGAEMNGENDDRQA